MFRIKYKMNSSYIMDGWRKESRLNYVFLPNAESGSTWKEHYKWLIKG